ncbi:MAG: hypothetical protein LBM97_02395 [Candidatus Nomurabacteria bacterium]|jgi:hypothetical protein|nr:hypothetical protein [Candidatus Nomurabacteria bacterium]
MNDRKNKQYITVAICMSIIAAIFIILTAVEFNDVSQKKDAIAQLLHDMEKSVHIDGYPDKPMDDEFVETMTKHVGYEFNRNDPDGKRGNFKFGFDRWSIAKMDWK